MAHKVVSKAEGRIRDLGGVSPGERALELAAGHGKDPRLVQVVLDESAEVLRAERGVIVSVTRHGFVCANAGVDRSNAAGEDSVVLLPEDPDASARRLRAGIAAARGVRPAVLVTDSFGRAWRLGQTDVAIGAAGLLALDDWAGRADAGGLRAARDRDRGRGRRGRRGRPGAHQGLARARRPRARPRALRERRGRARRGVPPAAPRGGPLPLA